MSAITFDGKAFANEWLARLKEERQKCGALRLAAVMVGEDPASASFLKEKEKAASALDVDFRLYRFSEAISNADLRKKVGEIGKRKDVSGLIVQLPLPAPINVQPILNAIPQEKDIDVLSQKSLGAFFVGRSPVLPPTVEATRKVLESQNIDVKKIHTVIAGAGRLVGKPLAAWFIQQGGAVSVVGGRPDDLKKFTREADILISGAGSAGLIREDMVKAGAVVIDFGFNKIGSKIAGDVDESAGQKAKFFTPVPGGMGPVTVAALMANLLTLVSLKK